MRRIRFKAKAFTIIEKLEIELLFIIAMVMIGAYYFGIYEGRSYFDSVYFSVITLAGVGYGDIVPHTQAGKVIAMVYAIFGIPLFIVAGSLIVQYLIGGGRREDEDEE